MKKILVITLTVLVISIVVSLSLNKPGNLGMDITKKDEMSVTKEKVLASSTPISIDYLRKLDIDAERLEILEELSGR